MDDKKRSELETLFNGLKPEEYELSPFPPKGDDGDGHGDDRHLAEIIEMSFDPSDTSGWNGPPSIGEKQIEFAIKLGRALGPDVEDRFKPGIDSLFEFFQQHSNKTRAVMRDHPPGEWASRMKELQAEARAKFRQWGIDRAFDWTDPNG